MPEEPKPEEEKKEPSEPATAEAAQPNGAPTAEELNAIKAELDQEKQATEEGKKALVHAQAMITERDARIAELEAQLTEANKGAQAATAAAAAEKEAHSKAVSKYLDAVKLANSSLPADVITGSTIAEIDASVAKALSIAESVKKTLEAKAKEARVPAGAPTRGEISLEGLSPREKIAAGIAQKGGTS